MKRFIAQTRTDVVSFIPFFKTPLILISVWIVGYIVAPYFDISASPIFNHIQHLILIFLFCWVLIVINNKTTYYIQRSLNVDDANNLEARSSLTKIKLIQKLINAGIMFLGISISLLTFEQARSIGLSLLTSAGIVGIIIGFAAQKSIGMILAGLQLAFTQPIRFGDVVVVEDEWGKIEELTLTYVVIKIWDERRLVLPVNYFLENPIQNWTRTSADIIGSVFIKVNLTFDVDEIRKLLTEIISGSPDWDNRVMNVQVTDCLEFSKEVRILVSSSDASKNWDLRVYVREKLLQQLSEKFPDSFVQQSISIRASKILQENRTAHVT
jgi:small-conductance mechanosensitive channel